MAINLREIVLDSLIEIIEKGEYSHIIEKAVLDKYDYLPSNEKAFIKRTCEGTLENLIAIDEVINRYSKVKVNKQKPLIRTLLRMSIYQLLYMDGVPDSAICNEAVKLASKRGFRTLGGFVNGVLRAIARDKDNINLDSLKVLPDWLYEHLSNSYGKEKADIICEDFKHPHKVTIRARRPLKDITLVQKVEGYDNVYTLSKGTSVKDIPGYEDGDFIVQDISSMMVGNLSGIKKGDVVLDVCAAPGGKSIHAYDLGGKVYSSDLTYEKVAILNENAKRCKADIDIRMHDATILDESMVDMADVVIADVPCSGLGIIGKKSDIRLKIKPENMDALVDIQRDIISTVYKYIKKNGTLMYSTCTLNPKENELQAKWIEENLPLRKISEKQFLPGIDNTDGFYIAKFIRE